MVNNILYVRIDNSGKCKIQLFKPLTCDDSEVSTGFEWSNKLVTFFPFLHFKMWLFQKEICRHAWRRYNATDKKLVKAADKKLRDEIKELGYPIAAWKAYINTRVRRNF